MIADCQPQLVYRVNIAGCSYCKYVLGGVDPWCIFWMRLGDTADLRMATKILPEALFLLLKYRIRVYLQRARLSGGPMY